MNKKVNRSTEWYLLKTDCPKALKDKDLTATDKNVLSVYLMLDNMLPKGKDGSFFRTDEKLLQDLEDSNCPISDRQLKRVKVKLKKLGYLSYVSGFHNNTTGKGSATSYWIGLNNIQSVDNQVEEQNNVTPNTNTNTKPNTKSNSICTYNNGGCNTSNISTLYGECEQTVNNEQLFCVDGESDIQRKCTNIKKDIDNSCFSSLEQLDFRIALDRIPATESRQIKQHYYQWDRENIYDSEEEDNTPMVQENIDLDYKSLYSNL